MSGVEYDYITGHPNEVLESLNRTLGQYKRHYNYIKVGITSDPKRRFNEHNKYLEESEKWDKMVVIYESTSAKYVKEIETYLVDQHWDFIENETGGGGGSINNSGPKYYVYVLLD